MNDPGGRRGGWRIEFGPGGPRGPRGPRQAGGGDRPTWPPFSRRGRVLLVLVLLAILALIGVFLRPLLHAPLMFVWRAPLPWLAAAVVLVVGRVVSRRAPLTVADLQAGRDPRRGMWVAALGASGIAFLVMQALNPVLEQRSLAANTTYAPISAFPATGIVRLVPREVASRIMVSGFNSSTEQLTDLAVVNTKDGLKWSAIRSPQGTFRRYTARSGGLELQDAQNPSRSLEQADANFKYAPGLAVFDALDWQLRKRRLLADLAAPVGILDDAGRPLILVPYLTYSGFPIRHPKLGGAFVVHPNGRIEDLSPQQAARRPEIVRSGRLFPDTLTRRLHDAYALKGGIWNYLVLHKNQTQIVDTEQNRQPYLLQGPGGRPYWVSVAQPYGASSATTAIFLTDSTTGTTRLWKVAQRDALTGNTRAVDITESLAIPGVDFGIGGVSNPGSGSFRAMEPRPVFVKGKLYFIVSVVPSTLTTVTRTVVVDAQTNQSIAQFETTTAGLQATLDFLKNGPGGSTIEDDMPAATSPDQPKATTADAPVRTTPLSRAELQRRVEQAIERQQQSIDALKDLQRELTGATR